MTNADKWSAYWQDEGLGGEVFVNAEGNASPGITRFWQEAFSDSAAGARVIDLAAGAGAVFRALGNIAGQERYAADFSTPALQLVRKDLPDVLTLTCDAAKPPLADGAFDYVVSQFGIEYAGDAAFEAAGRLLAPGGRLIALCHYEGGNIHGNNEAELKAAEATRASNFIGVSTELARALFSRDQARFDAAHGPFQVAERTVALLTRDVPGGIHTHLYNGFRQLAERYQHYDESDITGWLAAMDADLTRNIDRLTQICRAAANESTMRERCATLSRIGLTNVVLAPFQLPEHDRPVAWHLEAGRP